MPTSDPVAIPGDVTIVNTTDSVINLSCLVEVTGDLIITGNTAATAINLADLVSVGGNREISGNTAAGNLDLGSLGSVSGNLEITDNSVAGNLDLGSLGTVSGELVIENNGNATVNVAALASVGDLTLEATGSSNLDLSGTSASGDLDLATAGYGVVSGKTAGGTTTVTVGSTEARMTVSLPTGTFTEPTTFTLSNFGSSANPGQGDACDAPGYIFVGFFRPVDNLPALNLAHAGSAIPMKFSLGGNQGMDVLAPGYPSSVQVACDASQPAGLIEATVNAGGSSLTYEAAVDQYAYVWKTSKAWAGTCRLFVMRLCRPVGAPSDVPFQVMPRKA